MAARQDQTLQIALILAALLVLVLGGFLFYVNRLRAEHLQEAQAAEQQSRQDKNALNNITNQANELRTLIGFDQFEEFDSVKKQFEEDMQQFGATFGADDLAYRTVLASIFDENRRSTELESEAKNQVKQLNEQILALEAAKEAQIKQFQQELAKVKADAAGERNDFNKDRGNLTKQRSDLAAALERTRAEEKKRADAFRRQIAQRDSEINTLQENLRRTLDRLPVPNPTSEVADGRVTWVNQASGTAWINLGSADSLQRQVTFSVFEQDATDAGKAEKKGSLEVVRILGDHSAEVRITSDDIRNPILPGDWIYSQLWQGGQRIRFALTGVIDFDGDGANDIQQAKDLIALNGGAIDAILEEDGSITGEITVNTRYLVLGEFPGSTRQAELRKGWETMTEDADKYDVDRITLQQFLDQMGYRPAGRTVAFGPKARSADFRPRSPYNAGAGSRGAAPAGSGSR